MRTNKLCGSRWRRGLSIQVDGFCNHGKRGRSFHHKGKPVQLHGQSGVQSGKRLGSAISRNIWNRSRTTSFWLCSTCNSPRLLNEFKGVDLLPAFCHQSGHLEYVPSSHVAPHPLVSPLSRTQWPSNGWPLTVCKNRKHLSDQSIDRTISAIIHKTSIDRRDIYSSKRSDGPGVPRGTARRSSHANEAVGHEQAQYSVCV